MEGDQSSQSSPFGCIISLAIIALAVFGGYTLYNRITTNAKCNDLVAWYNETVKTANIATLRQNSLDPYEMSQADMAEEARYFQGLAADQIASNPPKGGEEFSKELTSFYQMIYATWNGYSHNTTPTYSIAELEAQAFEVERVQNELRSQCD